MLIEQDEFLYIIPHYFPLRNFLQEGNKFIVDLGSGDSFKRIKLDFNALQILKKFLSPCSISEILESTKLPAEEVKKFHAHLINEKIIIRYQRIPNEYARYDRHLQYYSLQGLCPIAAQEKLKNLTITLVGSGGIGNWVALNLVGLGIKKLRLIDPDVIEESNLSRQVLFSEQDVGKKKVDIAARELKKRNNNLSVESISQIVNGDNVAKLVENTDFVVLSADRPFFLIQKWLNNACIKSRTPLLNVGYAEGEGIMGPMVISGKSACLDCLGYFDKTNYYIRESKDAEEFSNHFRSPSFACLNSLIACMASYEIVKFFLCFGECITIDHSVRVNPLDFSVTKIICKRKPTCKICQQIG